MSIYDKYEAVIGLEVHAQLSTKSKIFCGCSTEFGSAPNSNVCPICLGMPGVLPVLNKQVVEFAIRLGLATQCSITPTSIFARKNYFYPDLPKGYQISQYEEPICQYGHVDIELEDGTVKRIGITRIHMEEDAGKLIHDMDVDTLVDVNRCGTPLLEIVSEPEMHSSQEAVAYLRIIWQTVKDLEICDGNMEEGSFRCDANVSVRLKGETKLGTKAELKNMNSFRNVERAIDYEIKRQTDLIEDGGTVVQETLLWNADKNIATSMRSKEEAHDYRYFPDPDLVPVVVSEEWIKSVKASMPKLANEKKERFMSLPFQLPEATATILSTELYLTQSMDIGFEYLKVKKPESVKLFSNWLIVDSLSGINSGALKKEELPSFAPLVSGLVNHIVDQSISGSQAKFVFEEMVKTRQSADVIISKHNLHQISDTGAIETEIDAILAKFPSEIARFRGGDAKLMGFFVGETMKVMKGKGNPKVINEVLRKKLDQKL